MDTHFTDYSGVRFQGFREHGRIYEFLERGGGGGVGGGVGGGGVFRAGILQGGAHGPRKRKSVGIFILTSQKTSEGGKHPYPHP